MTDLFDIAGLILWLGITSLSLTDWMWIAAFGIVTFSMLIATRNK